MADLITLHRDSEIHDLGDDGTGTGRRNRRFVTGGDIYNPLPFDGGPRAPGNFIYADGVQQGNWVWLGKGEQGYLIKKNTGTVRVYPVRGDQTKYIQISGLADKVCDVNQINDRNLEIYQDKPYTRWSLKMGVQGFEPEILLKPGYSGDGTFQFRFELNGGLTLDGAKIMDGVTEVLRMHKPWLEDANGTIRGIDEDLTGGIVTFTADLSNLVYPILIDPTLGPIGVNMDTHFRKSVPTEGSGQLTVTALNAHSVDITRALYYFDISAITSGATIVSSTFELWYQQKLAGNPFARQMDLLRMTVPDWEDRGTSTLGDEANWNNYKDPSVAWPGGAGALGDTDNTDLVSADVPAAPGVWITWTPLDMTQDALDNRAGILNMFLHFTDETAAGGEAVAFSSLENATAAQRPKLTVEYSEVAGNIPPHPFQAAVGL